MIGKIVLTLVATLIWLSFLGDIWKDNIDVPRTIKRFINAKLYLAKKFEDPKLKYNFDLIPQRISEGVEVYGIKWKDDYKEFRFYLSNTSSNVEIKDIRVRLELLDGIVKSEINQHSGSENISFSQGNSPSGIYQNDKMTEVTKEYSNTLLINAARIFPKGYFEIRLISKVLPDREEPHPGYFEVNYRYEDGDGNTKNKVIAHDIFRKDANSQSIYINIEKEIQNQKDRSHVWSMTFDKPLALGKSDVKNDVRGK